MDMGFTRDHGIEALLVCGNDLTTAMEWILTHPPPAEAASSGGHSVSFQQRKITTT